MTTADDLLRRALEALEGMNEDGWLLHGPEGMDEYQQAVYDSIKEIRAYLDAPKQNANDFIELLNEAIKQCKILREQTESMTPPTKTAPKKPMTEEEILEVARNHYNPYQRA